MKTIKLLVGILLFTLSLNLNAQNIPNGDPNNARGCTLSPIGGQDGEVDCWACGERLCPMPAVGQCPNCWEVRDVAGDPSLKDITIYKPNGGIRHILARNVSINQLQDTDGSWVGYRLHFELVEEYE